MTTPVFFSESRTRNAESARYLSVNEVADRLGLPVDLVIRRVEAGDVPARRVDAQDGSSTYELRLSDLGMESYAEPSEVAGVVEVTGTVAVSREEFTDGTSALASDFVEDRSTDLDVEAMVPPPVRRDRHLAVVDDEDIAGPLNDIAGMSIDPRELVAGLLDRWERTLEQRIYAEQRQRFESELVARQTMVKELQMELRTARAEHAAAQAEKDRALAERDHAMIERERLLAEAERDLDQSRRAAQQAQIQLQAQQARKRGWLFRR